MSTSRPTSSRASRTAHSSSVSRKSSLPPTMLQQPASGARFRSVSKTRPCASTSSTPTPTRGRSESTIGHSSRRTVSRRGFPQRGPLTFRKRKSAKEKCRVEGVSGQSVSKKRQAREIAGTKPSKCVRKGVVRAPHRKVRHQKELQRAKEHGAADARHAAIRRHPAADEHVHEKAHINHRHQAVKAHKQVACEKRS